MTRTKEIMDAIIEHQDAKSYRVNYKVPAIGLKGVGFCSAASLEAAKTRFKKGARAKKYQVKWGCVVCKKPIPVQRGTRAATCSKECSAVYKPTIFAKPRKPVTTEYQKSILKIGWNQIQAAKFLGIDPRTSRRYAAGELRTPAPIQVILDNMLRMKPKP